MPNSVNRLSAFVAKIKTMLETWQLAESLKMARQTEPIDPNIVEAEDSE
jgi:hypothetical protein